MPYGQKRLNEALRPREVKRPKPAGLRTSKGERDVKRSKGRKRVEKRRKRVKQSKEA